MEGEVQDTIPALAETLSSMANLNSLEDTFVQKSNLCLDGRLAGMSQGIVISGGFADVYTGYLGSEKVAIKVIRPFGSSGKSLPESKLLKRLWREYLAWSRLSHPNVLQCLGYTFVPQSYVLPALISPWMSNGTALEYLEGRPSDDRMALVFTIAEAVCYLHSQGPVIVHGDLRAGNILVSESGVPCLCDFGLSRVLSEIRGMTTSSEPAGAVRWMSPELLQEDDHHTVQSDVWAFGMTTLEILSGKRPYCDLKKDAAVLFPLMKGVTPVIPRESTQFVPGHIWEVCGRCWSLQPIERPSMHEVKDMLHRKIVPELSVADTNIYGCSCRDGMGLSR